MKHFLLASAACIAMLHTSAQNTAIKAYAITAATKGSYSWTEVKQIDLSSGEITQSVFESSQKDFAVIDAATKQPIAIKNEQGVVTNPALLPFSNYAAACAFDQRHNLLFYNVLFDGQLRCIDLGEKTPTFRYFTQTLISKEIASAANESGNITRMVIAGDGNGYALTNDGNHLIRFTTGRKPVITDLGAVADDPANGSISFHTKSTSWGGDMVADAGDNLYVISAPGYVFKVNITAKKATLAGKISGLPSSFTTNGAAVVADDKLIVSSANSVEAYFEVDMNSWTATRIASKTGTVFNASDLANSNLAFKNKQTTATVFSRQLVRNDKIGIFPNPVTSGVVKVTFNVVETGRYDIQLVDISGRAISQKAVSVGNAGQVVELPVAASAAKGIYLVKVINAAKKTVCADQVVIAD